MGRKSRDIAVLRERNRELRVQITEKSSAIRDLELGAQYMRALIAEGTKSNRALQEQLREVSKSPEQVVESILNGIAPLFIGYREGEETQRNRLNEMATSMGVQGLMNDGGDDVKGWVPEFEMEGESWVRETPVSETPTSGNSGNGKRRSEVGPIAPPPGFEVG
jgi:hypothetical protein